MEVKKIETTKEYLNQISYIDVMINNTLSEISMLRDTAYNISICNDKERVQTSKGRDILGDTVAKIYDLEKEADTLVDEYADIKRKIVWQINGLIFENKLYTEILFKRYVEKKTFEEIAVDLHMSSNYIKHSHGDALVVFERKYGEEYLGKESFLKLPKQSTK